MTASSPPPGVVPAWVVPMTLKTPLRNSQHKDAQIRRPLLIAVLLAAVALAPAGGSLEALSVPANDAFADAIAIGSAPYSNTQSTVNATNEVGEPFGCSVGESSVWYTYTAANDDQIAIDTFGSEFDTVLAVYTGTSVDALTRITCNDDHGSLQSLVTFGAVAGTSYQIQVSGFVGDVGDLVLNLDTFVPPGNDHRVDAVEISSLPFHANQTTFGAGLERGEGRPCGSIGATVWYRHTPEIPGILAADTFGSDFDTVLAVWVEVDGLLVRVACNDDARGLQSAVEFPALPGQTYFLQVGGYWGETGHLALSVSTLV